ncbi:protein transport protein Sec1p [[Candida] anglica]|uniref:Protein transport protein Sec1p n=1 Tax=[Candida] anglica TaxID=148631 RepID=A0ABP0EAW8_9ASCO
MSSLLALSKQYLVDAIKSYQKSGALTSLIIDESIEPTLYRIVPKESLLRYVTSVELIDAPRKIQPFIEAIYLVPPTQFNLNCMAADISVRRYKHLHVLFSASPGAEFRRLVDSSPPGTFASVSVLPLTFFPVEAQVFVNDTTTPNSMPIYYNENCRDLVMKQINAAAKSLVSVMAITGEYPLIRYYSSQEATHPASRLPELIANEFQIQIDNYARENENFPPALDKPRSILLITDRTMDLYAPLLHEFSYQAMAMDIVKSLEREGVYRYESENEKGEHAAVTVRLDNESDLDWLALRHLHIIESSELIIAKINDLIAKNPLMVNRSEATTSTDLMYIVAHLKGFDEERKQVTLHKSLIDACLDINGERKLAEFAADFEQTCAAGGTSFEGVRNKQLANDLIDLLAREDLHVNDKMRLVLIYALYRGGLIEDDFKKLVKFIGLRDGQTTSVISRCFTNLHKLGFPVVKPDVKIKRIDKKEFHTINNEGTFNTSRFGPGVKSVVSAASKYQLDETWFPYFRDKPLEEETSSTGSSGGVPGSSSNSGSAPGSLRNPRIKASWAQSSTKVSSGLSRPKQRIFCYVAGGMTYSEMRSVYELTQGSNNTREYFIGSESILKPRDFLIGLQDIDTEKTRADLDLNVDKMSRKPTKAPSHLSEVPAPKPAPGQHSQSMSAMGGQHGPSPASQQQSSSSLAAGRRSSVPSHYQTRLGSQGASMDGPASMSSGESKEKKKKSRLKSLFK